MSHSSTCIRRSYVTRVSSSWTLALIGNVETASVAHIATATRTSASPRSNTTPCQQVVEGAQPWHRCRSAAVQRTWERPRLSARPTKTILVTGYPNNQCQDHSHRKKETSFNRMSSRKMNHHHLCTAIATITVWSRDLISCSTRGRSQSRCFAKNIRPYSRSESDQRSLSVWTFFDDIDPCFYSNNLGTGWVRSLTTAARVKIGTTQCSAFVNGRNTLLYQPPDKHCAVI